jgi:hypothetical protein
VLDEVFMDPAGLFVFEITVGCMQDPPSRVSGMHEFCQLVLAIASANFSGVEPF